MVANTPSRRAKSRVIHLTFLSLLSATGCAAATSQDAGGASSGASKPVSAIDRDLAPGAEGADVAALHGYLSRYGYLPNEELTRERPGFTPIVDESPAHDDVYDEISEAAVRAFQRNMGLEPTGVVDAATRAQLAVPRCGNPDGQDRLELRPKYALSIVNPPFTDTTLTWRYNGGSDLLTVKQVKAQITAAGNVWSKTTALTFREALGSEVPDIQVLWGQFSNSDTLGETAPDSDVPATHVIRLAADKPWSVATPTPSTSFDLQSVLIHEMGHAIGIAHTTNVPAAVMWASTAKGERKRVLDQEDAIPASILYDQWNVLTAAGFAKDIAVSSGGVVWVVGDCGTGNCPIKKLNGTTWETADSSGLRIAVTAGGVPWMIKTDGTIWKRSSSAALTGQWNPIPGCAKDLAVGQDGSVWSLGCETAFGGFSIKKWNAGTKTWQTADGVAIRIAVRPDGRPQIIGPDGVSYIRSEPSATSGAWDIESGVVMPPDELTDIAVDKFGYWYVIADQDRPGVFGMNGPPGDGRTFVKDIYDLSVGSARAIAVGKLPGVTNTGVYVVNPDGVVRHQTK